MSKYIKNTVIDIIRQHPEITTWDVDIYSIMNDHTETLANDDTFLYGTWLLERDDEYSFFGDAESDLHDYHEMYGDIDDPDDVGMLSALECEFFDFNITKHPNGTTVASIEFARDDVSHYIINVKKLHECRKIHTNNGEYILLDEYDHFILIADECGNYIVCLDAQKEDDTHYLWSQGMYFVGDINVLPKTDTLDKAVAYFDDIVAHN